MANTAIKKITRAQRESRRAYSIIIPFFVYLAFWNLIPLVAGLVMGFTDYNGLRAKPSWVGFKNYGIFFESGGYLLLLWRQVWIGGLCLSINILLSFMTALALNVNSKARGFFRTSVYVPSIAAVAVTTAIFVSLLDPVNGGINRFLGSIGLEAVIWNYSQFWMVFWVIVYYVWRSLGPAAVIWLGGLQSIDPSLYEAARVDGASFWQQVRYITIPGLRFVAAFIMLTGIIGTMQMFDVIMFITKGNPYGRTDVLMYRIYRDGAVNFNLGLAGAASTILGLLTMVFAVIYFQYVMHREEKVYA